MVDLPRRGCPVPGCANYAEGRNDDCGNHPRAGHRERYDAVWATFSLDWLRRYPWCALCGARASEVDHKLPLRAGGAKFAAGNLRSLCHPCHSKITAATRADTGHGNRRSRRIR